METVEQERDSYFMTMVGLDEENRFLKEKLKSLQTELDDYKIRYENDFEDLSMVVMENAELKVTLEKTKKEYSLKEKDLLDQLRSLQISLKARDIVVETLNKELGEKAIEIKTQMDEIRKLQVELAHLTRKIEKPKKPSSKPEPTLYCNTIPKADSMLAKLRQIIQGVTWELYGTMDAIKQIKKEKKFFKDKDGFTTGLEVDDNKSIANKIIQSMLLYYHPDKQPADLSDAWKYFAQHATACIIEFKKMPFRASV